MWGKKNPEEELAEALKQRPWKRPSRTYCETCKKDFGSNYALIQHAKKEHS